MTCRKVVPVVHRGLYLRRCRNGTQAVPYGFAGGWFRSTTQVVYETFYLCAHCSYNAERCKALSVTCGDSSPKGRAKVAFSICSTSAPVVPTMLNAVPRLIHRLWRSPFPEGEGLGCASGLLLCPGEQRLDFLAVQSCKEQGCDDGGGDFRYGVGPPDHVHVSRQAQKIGYRQQHQHLAAQRDDG